MNTNKVNDRVEKIELDKNREYIKKAILFKAADIAKKKFSFFKLFPLAAIIFAAATGLYMKVDYNNSNTQRNDLGGIWCTYDDHNSGGNSKVWPEASTSCENLFVKSSPGFGGKGYAVRVTGTTGSKLGHDFIGVNTFLSEYSSCPRCNGIDIRKFKGIEFKIKGTTGSGELSVIIPHESAVADKYMNTCRSLTSYEDFESDITKQISSEWKTVKLDFRKNFKQPAWTKAENVVDIEKVISDANLIKWQYKGSNSNVDIWIDDLQLY